MQSDRDAILEEAEDLILDLTDSDSSSEMRKEQIVLAVAKFLDAVVPLDFLIPSPVGVLAEQADEIVFKHLVTQLMRVFHADPAKKAERIQRRQERRERRKARRQNKKEGVAHGN